jgi:hypothetical protein
MIKFPGTVLGPNRPEARAHGGVAACHAWSVEKSAGPRPGSQPSPAGNQPARPAATRAPARLPCADRARNDAVVCSPVARRWLNGARCCRRSRGGHREGAEQGGEGRGAPERRVDGEAGGEFQDEVGCDEVLQLGRGKGVRKSQEIVRIGDSGRSSPGNGGWWRRSAGIQVKERLPMAGGSGLGAGSGGERCGAREGDRRGVRDGSADEWRVGRFME